jgi:flavin reductase (DIM6/NTAB) family NADH-FMN oxidoreductase RutF
MPSGLYLVGSRSGDRANLMTANWVTQVATEPKLIGVAVEKAAVTHRLIIDGEAFSVCLLGRDDRAVVRRYAKPADWDAEAGTLGGLPVRWGRSGAPILGSAVAWVDCQVRHRLDCGSHTWFVGEVVDAAFAGEEGSPVLRMEDTRMSYGG